ncbi:MAG TPA: calcium/sodium antiporter [Balneolaceae bacterium]|nr:calcium/sodium antiporter [Balneolaceae bacterium]
MNIIYLVSGILLLTVGGEILIRGALSASNRMGISPLLIGLVVVGFGTSSPELAVSVEAALSSSPDISVGNVVGSNIGNVLLILGICAIISPIAVKPSALTRDGAVVVGSTLVFMIMIAGGVLGRAEAVILIILLAVYLYWAYRSEKNAPDSPAAEVHTAEAEEIEKKPAGITGIVISLVGGLILLIGGSNILLKGAIGIAETFNISEAVIGLTLVAVGTSLPELSISVLAAIRKHNDVAIGNILGSNIFNVLGILGVSAMIQPLTVNPRILLFDQWVLIGLSILILLFLYTGRKLTRTEGGILLMGYIAYVILSFTLFPG